MRSISSALWLTTWLAFGSGSAFATPMSTTLVSDDFTTTSTACDAQWTGATCVADWDGVGAPDTVTYYDNSRGIAISIAPGSSSAPNGVEREVSLGAGSYDELTASFVSWAVRPAPESRL